MHTTTTHVRAALTVALAVAETIRELGRVPSGTLYAQLLGRLSMEEYDAVIRTLKGAGLVREVAHELIWTGPNLSTTGV